MDFLGQWRPKAAKSKFFLGANPGLFILLIKASTEYLGFEPGAAVW